MNGELVLGASAFESNKEAAAYAYQAMQEFANSLPPVNEQTEA